MSVTKIPAKLVGQSGTYEVIPFRMAVSVIPEFSESSSKELTKKKGSYLLKNAVGGHRSDLQVDKAQRETRAILQHYRWRFYQGKDRRALAELLDLNPAFISVDWVAKEVLRLRKGGLFLRRRGRPKGRYEIRPLIVMGLVEHLIRNGMAENKEQAFSMLEELGVFQSYDSAKAAYYRAPRSADLQAILLENVSDVPLPSVEEIEAIDREAVRRYGRESQPFAVITGANVVMRKPDGTEIPITQEGTVNFDKTDGDGDTQIGSLKLGRRVA